MDENSLRMTEQGKTPTPKQIEGWLGRDAYGFWQRVTRLIEQNYPKVFIPDWLFGGKKHGWSLRYKKGRSFCTLIPEKNRLAILIVFGAEERRKVETIRRELSVRTRKDYDEAATYHDGKWLLITVDTYEVINDIELLLAVKRRSKQRNNAT